MTKTLKEIIDDFEFLLTTHTEKEGCYCDTGEDMEWGCRSECVEMARKRLDGVFKLEITELLNSLVPERDNTDVKVDEDDLTNQAYKDGFNSCREELLSKITNILK